MLQQIAGVRQHVEAPVRIASCATLAADGSDVDRKLLMETLTA